MNSFKMEFLKYTKQIINYCENAVHDTSTSTKGEYGAEFFVPGTKEARQTKSLIMQWNGRPNGLVYRDAGGSVDELKPTVTDVK